MSTRMLSDLLGRLVETVAEQGEDMQGYVTELMLTLESAVDALDSDFRCVDCICLAHLFSLQSLKISLYCALHHDSSFVIYEAFVDLDSGTDSTIG